jgi:hypothetical protein
MGILFSIWRLLIVESLLIVDWMIVDSGLAPIHDPPITNQQPINNCQSSINNALVVPLALHVSFELLERHRQTGRDHVVVPRPAIAVLESRLADLQHVRPETRLHVASNAIGPIGFTIRRQPVRIGDEELSSGFELDDRPFERTTETARTSSRHSVASHSTA